MGRGVKIGLSQGPKGRQDPFLGPFLVILSHFGPFGPFLTLFGHLGGGNGSKWVRNPYSWGKMGWGVKIGQSRGLKWPLLGPFFGHFEPYWALLGRF